jgi:hypothetical protein
MELNKIYFFSDLSFGTICEVNRSINRQHVAEIFNGLERNEWYKLGEIRVDEETKQIIDGNHRYLALQMYVDKYGSFRGNKVNVIYYTRPEGTSLAAAIRIFNEGRKALTTADYFKLSSYDGNGTMAVIDDFAKKHDKFHKSSKKGIKIYYRYVLALLYGKNVQNQLIKSSIDITPEIIQQGEILYNEIDQIMNAINNPKTGTWFEEMIKAWYYCRIKDELFMHIFPKADFKAFCKSVALEWNNTNMTCKEDFINFFNHIITYFA